MEEQVGQYWHRVVSGKAGFTNAAVPLTAVAPRISLFFRALGGDGGLQIEAAEATAHGARRSLRQRVAGSGARVALAWRDERSLRLPPVLDCLPDRDHNEALYYWLAALAAQPACQANNWFVDNQQRARAALQRLPGLRQRYRALVESHLGQRPDPDALPAEEAAAERAVRGALQDPGSVAALPPARHEPSPVHLWLHPSPPSPQPADDDGAEPDPANGDGEQREAPSVARRTTERAKPRKREGGLIAGRMEYILSFGEHVNVDRSEDDEEDLGKAEAVARDLDSIATTRQGRAAKSRLKFDLDLPGAAGDDLALDDGVLLPEWDHHRQALLPDRCRIVSMLSDGARPCELPQRLTRPARRLRDQFQVLTTSRCWRRAQDDGCEIDLDACLRMLADRAAGQPGEAAGMYRDLLRHSRDMACLLLADLSLSTDTWVGNQHRVIDVIRDSLFLFAESLAACNDRFGIYGFSSRRRDPVRVHTLKRFDERYGAQVRGRIDAIKPGFYTRLGAGIRHAANLLEAQKARQRLLLILSDGKPNDLDQYEGRYGIEDTRHAVREARQAGLQVFCVTVDERGNDYLPHLFGAAGYVVVRKPTELPRRLPQLYAQLTGA